MALDLNLRKKIIDFVYTKPRVVDEIAKLLDVSWRTADRYVDRIIEEDGSLAIRLFRENTQGALKIVYWNNTEKIHSSSFQEYLFSQISGSDKKEDFDPFDIYQYVDNDKKTAFMEEFKDPNRSVKQNLVPLLQSCQKELYIFSGNMTWINVVENDQNLIDVLEALAKQNINIKVLCKVDFASMNNLSKVFAINNKLGKEVIEIRHCKQPLRGFIIDDKVARFKEEKLVQNYTPGELCKDVRLFIEIYDSEWVAWLTKVFYNLFRNSIDGKNRAEQLKKIN